MSTCTEQRLRGQTLALIGYNSEYRPPDNPDLVLDTEAYSVDELAAPDMLLQYSLHEPRRGRDDIKAFMSDFRKAFPNLNFWGTADLIAEGDFVVGRWEGGGTPLASRWSRVPQSWGHSGDARRR